MTDPTRTTWRYAAGAAQGVIAGAAFVFFAFLFVRADFLDNPDRLTTEQWVAAAWSLTPWALLLVPAAVAAQHKPLLPRLATRQAAIVSIVLAIVLVLAMRAMLWYFQLQVSATQRLDSLP